MMETRGHSADARRFALIALAVFALAEAVTSGLFLLRRHVPSSRGIPAIPIATFAFFWAVPLLIVYLVEKRGASTLGLVVPRERYVRYALYAIVGLVVPAAFFGVDRGLMSELVEQLVYIGLAEEVFNRGYLMRRLCDWLGDRRGLLLSSLLFALSHIASLLSQHGFKYPSHDLLVGLQTFIGGLLLGYMYLRAKNIVPPAIFHVSTNMYLEKIVALLNS
jgi:membrane protease YdiL (CAAX protease family)